MVSWKPRLGASTPLGSTNSPSGADRGSQQVSISFGCGASSRARRQGLRTARTWDSLISSQVMFKPMHAGQRVSCLLHPPFIPFSPLFPLLYLTGHPSIFQDYRTVSLSLTGNVPQSHMVPKPTGLPPSMCSDCCWLESGDIHWIFSH